VGQSDPEFYLLLIPLTVGLMLLHNLGDWLRKVIGLRFRRVIAGENRFPTRT
jgi:hypothetical protein